LFQGTFEEDIEVDRLDTADEFLKCGEVGDRRKSQSVLDPIHFFEVTDNSAIVFLPVFFEKEKCQ
jgi:hypothetical protein